MRIGIQEISKRLADRCESVAQMLLPGGKTHGPMWECGGTNGNTGKSLKVNLTGAYAGQWKDWADVEGGDLLDLWASVKQISLPDAVKEAKQFLGIKEQEFQVKNYSKANSPALPLSPDGEAMKWMTTKRALDAGIVNRYKVGGDGNKRAIVFPSYTPDGRLVNHSYRTLTDVKEVWQDKGCPPCLFGWHAISDRAWEKREILICEGQIDAMTWGQWGFDALSIPNGGGRSWIDYEWQNLEVFQTIYLSFDNDGKSDENLNETILRLGKHRCRVVRFTEKDANSALQAGIDGEQARKWVIESKYPPLPNLVGASNYLSQVTERFFPSRDDSEGWALPYTKHRNPRKTFRFRNGELTLWTGTTGHGKSTLLNLSALLLALNCGEPGLIFSLETGPSEVIYRMIKGIQQNIANHKDIPPVLAAIDKVMLFYDRIGSIKETELFEVMAYAKARYGARDVVIDSMMRVEGLEENYPAQTALIIRLVTFARETGCRVHLVAHPRKSAGDESPKSQDIAGSGNIRNNADNVLVLWRNKEKEQKIEDGGEMDAPDAVLTVEKDRMCGEFRKFPLTFFPHNYRFESWASEKRDK